jgi:hypothetical protein
MLVASVLLVVIGLLGAFDVFFFHRHKARLGRRPDTRREAWIHVMRGPVYVLQFLVVPNLRFEGAAYALAIALYAADAAVAVADVLCEPASRRAQGGLPPGEYLMHIVLSVLVGAHLHAFFASSRASIDLPTALRYAPQAPDWLRLVLLLLAVGCALETIAQLLELRGSTPHRPTPVHVCVRLQATLARLWAVTQDHHRHPDWDHRFSRIIMLSDEIRTGTPMRYEKRLLGLTIRGYGRYALHAPLRQSTFQFWSDDWRSPIRRGVGLWRYRDLGGGWVELRTSYTYEVRWGGPGRLLDRLVLRPAMQRATERSFARLARTLFPDGSSPVTGRCGRKPAPAAEVPA